MLGYKLSFRKVSRLVLLVFTIFVLAVSLESASGSIYFYMLKESNATISSPPVILQNGTAGTSIIYTNNTSAKVNVDGFSNMEDYVDNNTSNVDSSGDKGTHSNFTSQKYGPDLINDTLTEENTGGSGSLRLYVDTDDETRTDWVRVGTNPYLDAIDHNSSYLYVVGNNLVGGDFNFTDSGKSIETIDSVTVQVYAQQSSSKDLEVFVWNGSSWASLGSQTLTTSWRWENYSATTVLDTWAEIDEAKMYVKSRAATGAYEVDCARLKVDYTAPDNHELDVEVQWTSLDFNQTNEELCIYGGTMGPENITIDVWNGTAWQNLLTNLTSGWNNVSVSSYLTSSNLTIRFKGDTETGDTTQDSWNIDATLLHVWTVYTYDYVLKVVNQVAENWTVNLQVYDSSNVGRLSSLNISLHDGTSSNQIAVSGGSMVKSEGEPYDLPGGVDSTIYIRISNLQATTTGTSNIYVHLKILVPNSSTYILHIITFEIT